MITRILAVLLVCSAAVLPVHAGQLDLAIIRFTNGAPLEEISAAIAKTPLAELTNADKTQTRIRELQGGAVLFAQSLGVSPGSRFASATRLNNYRADVEGSLGSGSINATITITEGVDSGLRNLDRKTHTGRGSLPAGPAKVISAKETRVKAPSVVKGKAKLETSSFLTVVVAQYRP